MIETSVIIGFTLLSTILIVLFFHLFKEDEPISYKYNPNFTKQDYTEYIKLAIISIISQLICFVFINTMFKNDSDILSAKVSCEIADYYKKNDNIVQKETMESKKEELITKQQEAEPKQNMDEVKK